MNRNFKITVVSLPDREKLVAEIFYNNEQWVEISQETEKLCIQFYNSSTNAYWEFSYEDSMEVLLEAKNKLLGMH